MTHGDVRAITTPICLFSQWLKKYFYGLTRRRIPPFFLWWMMHVCNVMVVCDWCMRILFVGRRMWGMNALLRSCRRNLKPCYLSIYLFYLTQVRPAQITIIISVWFKWGRWAVPSVWTCVVMLTPWYLLLSDRVCRSSTKSFYAIGGRRVVYPWKAKGGLQGEAGGSTTLEMLGFTNAD